MCGIAGIINKNQAPVDSHRLTAMRDSLLHRGPDAGDQWMDGPIGLAHRRLSIIDLSAAANQPFHSPCGRYVLVFNGEIFNYKEFKSELSYKGYQFRSESDTEVLLYLLMEYGTEVLSRLNGFWAFALWDKKEQTLLLVRDRLGVKPLFYMDLPPLFAFASEPKAFFAYGLPRELAEEHLDELFFYRHVSGENTIFQGVKRVLPGHFLRLNAEGKILENNRWFHLGEAAKNHSVIQNPNEWFRETFYSSIQYRMIADVPVGTLLSGGLDSSSVLYAQNALGYQNCSAWNIGFTQYKDDESGIAQKFATALGHEFYSYEFKNESLVNLTRKAIKISDEPFMHAQEPHLLGLCLQAKENVSVLLSGEAADELMGGYVRYKVHSQAIRYQLLQFLKYVPTKWLKSERWQKMQRYLNTGTIEEHLIMNANNIYIKDLESHQLEDFQILPNYRLKILNEAKEFYPKNSLRQLLYLEQFTHLSSLNDRNDRVSMGASIENREPFEDFRLSQGVFSLPDNYFNTKGKGKKLLMDSIGINLPNYITQHRKIGLSIPWNQYIKEIDFFKNHFESMEKSDLFNIGNFSQINVQQVLKNYKNGDRNENSLVRQLFFLNLWYNEYFNS